MLKIILKIWPALLPIMFYLFWTFLRKKFFSKKNYIEGKFELVENNSKRKLFSLENKAFMAVIYVTLILLILSLVFTAFYAKNQKAVIIPHKITIE